MTPLGIGIGLALLGLKLLTNADVIKMTIQLVYDIDNSELTGQEKTDYVMKRLKKYFNNILPIILEAVIKIVVLDMQNKNGTLKKKLEEQKNAGNS